MKQHVLCASTILGLTLICFAQTMRWPNQFTTKYFAKHLSDRPQQPNKSCRPQQQQQQKQHSRTNLKPLTDQLYAKFMANIDVSITQGALGVCCVVVNGPGTRAIPKILRHFKDLTAQPQHGWGFWACLNKQNKQESKNKTGYKTNQ